MYNKVSNIICCTFEKVNFRRCKPPNNNKEDLIMMKRSNGVHWFICLVLGGAVGSFLSLAVSMSSFYYGVLTIFAVIGCVLNIICGPDTKGKSDSNEDED